MDTEINKEKLDNTIYSYSSHQSYIAVEIQQYKKKQKYNVIFFPIRKIKPDHNLNKIWKVG